MKRDTESAADIQLLPLRENSVFRTWLERLLFVQREILSVRSDASVSDVAMPLLYPVFRSILYKNARGDRMGSLWRKRYPSKHRRPWRTHRVSHRLARTRYRSGGSFTRDRSILFPLFPLTISRPPLGYREFARRGIGHPPNSGTRTSYFHRNPVSVNRKGGWGVPKMRASDPSQTAKRADQPKLRDPSRKPDEEPARPTEKERLNYSCRKIYSANILSVWTFGLELG